jgi:asparagine synthase (glutamine-hydrolysing)
LNNNYNKFVNILTDICIREKHDGILLSGGLDSSILAYHTRPKDAITVIIDSNAPDYFYSSLIANKKKYIMNHHIITTSFNDILSNIEELIKDFNTFDPIFLKNSVVQLQGLKTAKKLKIASLVIGDGADEIFAGYNFLLEYIGEPNIIESKINSLISDMDFVSIKLSDRLGLKIFLPFLEPEIIEFSKHITVEEKISNHHGNPYGKYFLRKCYENILGKEVVWREKTALENGSGVTFLNKYIDNTLLTNYEYKDQKEKAKLEGVEIRNKEHLWFYKTYRKFFSPPMENKSIDEDNNKRCPYCKSIFLSKGKFCKICGAFPVTL